MKRVLIIGGSILALLGLGYFLSKPKTTTDTNKNTTGSNNPDETDKEPENGGGTDSGSGVIIFPDGGEEEKVSKQLRKMNVRDTNTTIALWTNPYNENEYFIKFNDIEVLKWTKATFNPNIDHEQAYMPRGMTFISTTAYPTYYKPYDVDRYLKGGRFAPGYVVVAHEMMKDLTILAAQSPELSLYL